MTSSQPSFIRKGINPRAATGSAHHPKRKLAARQLRNRRRRRGRSVFTVSFLDLRAHLLQALALIHHFHHVTRDAYADASSKAHSIKDRICGG
jgi:hypothetical protein